MQKCIILFFIKSLTLTLNIRYDILLFMTAHLSFKQAMRRFNKVLKIKRVHLRQLEKLAQVINYIEFFDEKAEKYPEITFYKQISDKLIKNFEHLINKYIK